MVWWWRSCIYVLIFYPYHNGTAIKYSDKLDTVLTMPMTMPNTNFYIRTKEVKPWFISEYVVLLFPILMKRACWAIDNIGARARTRSQASSKRLLIVWTLIRRCGRILLTIYSAIVVGFRVATLTMLRSSRVDVTHLQPCSLLQNLPVDNERKLDSSNGRLINIHSSCNMTPLNPFSRRAIIVHTEFHSTETLLRLCFFER